MARQVIGIDFGTTYSSVALMDIGSQDRPRLIQFRHASEHVPTVLLVDPNDQSVISWGWEAQGALRSRQDVNVLRYFKRELGSGTDANRACKAYLSKLAEKVRNVKNLEVLSGDDFLTCIGAPATWTPEQRNMLKNMATEVGFPEVRVLDEPIAAMHNLRCQSQRRFKFGDRSEKYMVVDFGGGTLDICIVRTAELGRNPDTNHTDGDPHLGGIDFDLIIETVFIRQADLDVDSLSVSERADLRRQIQDAKEAFSEAFSNRNDSAHYTINLPDGNSPLTLPRNVFENLCRDQGVFEKIELAIDRSINEAGLKPTDIRKVILTGGSSKWYFVKQIVSKKMGLAGGDNLFYTETPFTDVACGLAVNIGRTDEPPEKPGVWVRSRIDGGVWSEKKVVMPPGRIAVLTEEQRLYLCGVLGSKVLRCRKIDLEWSHGLHVDKTKTGLRSVIRIHARSNHPRLERLKKVREVLSGQEEISQKPDQYQIFLIYREDDHGYPHYVLEVQDNRHKCINTTIVPGEDLYHRWMGFGRSIRMDHDVSSDEQTIKDRPKRSRVKLIINTIKEKISRGKS